MSQTEPEVKTFLLKIVKTISSLVLWLMFNVLLGLKLQWALVFDHFNVFNIIFYTWFLVSLPFLLYYFYRTWRV